MGKSVVSEADRREVKKAKKEGRVAEAMLDRRQKLKQCVQALVSFADRGGWLMPVENLLT